VSFQRSRENAALSVAMRGFAEAPEQRHWLPDWTLFAALKKKFGGLPWSAWEKPLAFRDEDAIFAARAELAEEIAYQEYVQFLFFHQWERVRRAARARGIGLFGDIPIYLAMDSADVWAHPELFQLDDARRPLAVSGVPPDYFSETGQLWGNPLYAWDRIAQNAFAWWIERLRANLRLVDLLRLDHFRGFAGYWAVPNGAKTAMEGEWRPGPGLALFRAAEEALGRPLPLVAEDLGVITEDVRRLLTDSALPGMRVLQFAFSEEESEHRPHRYDPRCVVYTGTHDNDTARGWFAAADAEERSRALDYLGGDGAEIHWDLLRAAYASVAERAIAPLQDVLGLGSAARMNNPAKPGGNWGWRAREDALDPAAAERLHRLARLTGRG
jgi:4-alpha-glucanotransferase